ncbi:hypothetical protein RCG23_03300 [Neobacillus sp. PS3-34]|uniref:hypothetical protein n=1 Tax=Neobacillus sp. PS3-34 TaxID=3070678 RepID=UPI0027DF898F|nr:hypothetical protein [Neobacillus sp. PS3-34]WML49137.1 hypothetical protein RCG23_03300 [Neobacillus sp. PS3-34]
MDVSLNQQHVLKQFQIIFENKKMIGTEPGVYKIPGTDFLAGVDYAPKLKNGINFTKKDFTIFVNGYGTKKTYSEIKAENLENVYTNYLVYRYSSYLTPSLIFYIFISSILKYTVVFGVLYLIITMYEYMLFRSGITPGYSYFQRSTKFKFCIAAMFVSALFYSYGSFIIKDNTLINMLAILIGSSLIVIQIKIHKRGLLT